MDKKRTTITARVQGGQGGAFVKVVKEHLKRTQFRVIELCK
jgi:hypothetical protein